MEPIRSKWIDYGQTVDNTSTSAVTNLSTTNNRLIRFTGAGASLSGLADGLSAGNNLPRELMISNVTGGLLVVKNEDPASTAANRILTGTGSDVTLADGGSTYLRYDPSSARWRIVGQAAGSNAVINPGDTGKFPYYNGSTSIDDTSSGTATAGMFWTNAARIVRLGISNTLLDSVTAQNGLVVGSSQTVGFLYGSILSGDSNQFVGNGTLDRSILVGLNNTNIGGTIRYSTVSGSGFQLPTGSDLISHSNVSGNAQVISGSVTHSGLFGDSSRLHNLACTLSSGVGNWIKQALAFGSGNATIGRYLSVYGYGSVALGGTFPTSDRSFALANGCLIQGGATSAGAGLVSHFNNSLYGQVMGEQCVAGNWVYDFTRSGNTITVSHASVPATQRESFPFEFVQGKTCRFFQLGGTGLEHTDVQILEAIINTVPGSIVPYNSFTFDVPNGALFGTKVSGKLVVLEPTGGDGHGFASGRNALARTPGQFARANGKFSSEGDAQVSTIVMRKATTTNAPTVMTLDGGTTSFLRVPLRTAWAFTITVVGKREGAFNTSAMYKFEGLVVRQLEADDPVIIGTPATLTIESDPTWDCALSVNTTNNSLDLTVTGGAYNVKWVARVDLTEVNAG
jgi:hypothetical protein